MKNLTVNRLLGIVLIVVGIIGAYVLFRNLLWSIPLLVVGLVLLLLKPYENEKLNVEEKPTGVIIVAILTLLASFGLACLSVVLFFLNFIAGMTYASTGIWIDIYNVYVLFPPLYTLFSFIASILLLTGTRTKHMWYAMVVFWILLFAFCSWMGYYAIQNSIGGMILPVSFDKALPYLIMTILILLIPLTYSLGCLLCFQKLKVKKYFHIK